MIKIHDSVKAPVLTANSNKQQESFIKVTTGNTTVNQTSLTQLEGMVPSETTLRSLRPETDLLAMHNLSRGDRERKEGGRPQAETARVQRDSHMK